MPFQLFFCLHYYNLPLSLFCLLPSFKKSHSSNFFTYIFSSARIYLLKFLINYSHCISIMSIELKLKFCVFHLSSSANHSYAWWSFLIRMLYVNCIKGNQSIPGRGGGGKGNSENVPVTLSLSHSLVLNWIKRQGKESKSDALV